MIDIYGSKEELKTLKRIMKVGVENFGDNATKFLMFNGYPVEIDCNYHEIDTDGINGEICGNKMNEIDDVEQVRISKKKYNALDDEELNDIFLENFGR